MKQYAPATARNREPIREVLADCLPARGLVLEIASGTGEHAVYMAGAFPEIAWQPSDIDANALASIAAWCKDAALPNLRTPIRLDVKAQVWPITSADAIVCINMIHISPWEATLGLFAGAARTLPADGTLYLYGPVSIDGKTASSNVAFDRNLQARDSRYGIRDVADLRAVATDFELEHLLEMPANNHSLVFRRRTPG